MDPDESWLTNLERRCARMCRSPSRAEFVYLGANGRSFHWDTMDEAGYTDEYCALAQIAED